jgi:hypothetical protein
MYRHTLLWTVSSAEKKIPSSSKRTLGPWILGVLSTTDVDSVHIRDLGAT